MRDLSSTKVAGLNVLIKAETARGCFPTLRLSRRTVRKLPLISLQDKRQTIRSSRILERHQQLSLSTKHCHGKPNGISTLSHKPVPVYSSSLSPDTIIISTIRAAITKIIIAGSKYPMIENIIEDGI